MKRSIFIFNNAKCVNCGALEEEMRRVGAVIFCLSCCVKIFKTIDPVRDERETYLKFLL